jgi:purine-cytosine permease-like protein
MSQQPDQGTGTRSLGLETLHIDHVPADQRHGRAGSLFTVWFASNLCMATVVTGALAVLVGNTLFWGLVALVVGNLAGAIFMALHSAQGPRLGVPQLIQGRGQFGYHGAILAVVLALFMYVGFFVFTAVPAGQSLHALSSSISVNLGVVLVAIPSLFIAIIGYRAIHLTQRVTTYLVAASLVVLTIGTFAEGIPSLSTSGFSAGPFLLAVAIIAVYQAGFAPYVSDYSRYLPEDIGVARPFWNSYLGTTLGGIWVMVLGAILAAQFTGVTDTVVGSAATVSGSWKVFVLGALTLGAVGINAMNLYGGMLSLLTGWSSFRTPPKGAPIRIVGICVIGAIGLWLSLAASANLVANYTNFLLLLVYGFVPWTAINLTDYYIVRRGHYNVPAFFDPHGEYFSNPATMTYGGFNVIALASFAIGVLAQLPFINTTYWVGWFVNDLSGADISWMIGLVVSSGSYLLLTRWLTPGLLVRTLAPITEPALQPAPESL